MRCFALVTSAVLVSYTSCAQANEFEPQVGQTFKIVRVVDSEWQRGDDGNGTTYDRDTIIERVISVRDEGLQLEYDEPAREKGEQRPENWQFPAQIFKPRSGPPQLLNAPELERRLGAWLAKAKWDRSICGKWIFTWNAFRIDCDPASVLKVIEPFDLRPNNLTAGAPYRDEAASAPALVIQKAGSTLVANLTVDPDFIRRASVETDLVVAEISGETLSREDALRKHAADSIAGTMVVTFETDSVGQVKRRTSVTTIETVDREGKKETRKTTETVERHQVR